MKQVQNAGFLERKCTSVFLTVLVPQRYLGLLLFSKQTFKVQCVLSQKFTEH